MSKINDESGDNKNNKEIYIYSGPLFCIDPKSNNNKPKSTLNFKVEKDDTLSFISEIEGIHKVEVKFSGFQKGFESTFTLRDKRTKTTPKFNKSTKVTISVFAKGNDEQANGTIIVKEDK